MTLTSALDTAKSSLIATQAQTGIVSRNIANANVEGATRKYANVVTGPGGRVEVRSTAQTQNSVLYRNMLEATSSLGRSRVTADGLNRIAETVGDTELARSPAALIGNLKDALSSFAVSSNNYNFALSAVGAARDLATSLNEASRTVDVVRRDADKELGIAAKDMTDLLAEIGRLNEVIVGGTSARTDVTDFVDRRDQAIAKLSGYVGVTVQVRAGNDVALYTDSGVTLFDKSARAVEFVETPGLAAGQAGKAFRIDGVAVTGANSFMPVATGKIAGLVELRDSVAATYGTQLDEMARGLLQAFRETKAGGLDPKAGLFTSTQASDFADSTTGPVAGLAGRITIAAAVSTKPLLIRDGGINDYPATTGPYVSNTDGYAGFTDRLKAFTDAIDAPRSFADVAEADPNASLAGFAASSVSWLESRRSEHTAATDYKQTLLDRTKETLSDETGVNLETELTKLIELERSFQASSKLISTVDEMLAALLQSI